MQTQVPWLPAGTLSSTILPAGLLRSQATEGGQMVSEAAAFALGREQERGIEWSLWSSVRQEECLWNTYCLQAFAPGPGGDKTCPQPSKNLKSTWEYETHKYESVDCHCRIEESTPIAFRHIVISAQTVKTTVLINIKASIWVRNDELPQEHPDLAAVHVKKTQGF